MKVFASLLAADHLHLAEEIDRASKMGIDGFHIDVMDGHYVNNIMFGPMLTKEIRGYTKLPLNVHLMVENPETMIEEYCEIGVEWITMHYETCKDLNAAIETIHYKGKKAVIAIQLETPVSVLLPYLDIVDGVLITSVPVGIGGQTYERIATKKVTLAREMAKEQKSEVEIFVDGGVNETNVCEIKEAGGTSVVIGTALFKRKNNTIEVPEWGNVLFEETALIDAIS